MISGCGLRGRGGRCGRHWAQLRLDLLALLLGQLLALLDLPLLRLDPRLVCLRLDDRHLRRHRVVAAAAELGALALERARLGGLEPGLVLVARNGVELAAQRRDPPRVDDVVGLQRQHHRRVAGHHHLLEGHGLVRVLVAPQVLLARHLDLERLAAGRRRLVDGRVLAARLGDRVGAGGGRVADVVQEDVGDDRDHGHDRAGGHGPAQLERRVARDLGRLAAAPRPEAEQRVEEDRPDRPDHRQADEEDDLVEVVDLLRVLRRPGLGREHVRPGGCREQEQAATAPSGKEQRDSGGPGLGSTSHRRAILYGRGSGGPSARKAG